MLTSERYAEFIGNLKNAVERSGLRHRVIAERCGMTPNQFSARLHMRQKVDINDIPVICEVLGIQPNELFARSA